ncbi:ornithine cyclodeaminase family protein [Spelaeicoccus albus]|uniref:Ornithine cyclodeaminase n=1 Tax=Spelaeicoccus albus TaxID=1280376 RepID=A0A7Z0IHF8_9MICO|nr:ornithine cyclodeaminase family protein [Spelaeicoccus albus]NYI67684.1 ornithine cyclodeaminase [Spelaeicoccus albus]
MIPWITAEQVARTVSPAEAVDALTTALRAGLDPAADPARAVVEVRSGSILFMPSDAGDHAGVKLATVAPDNPDKSLPRIQGLYVLLDSATLAPQAVIDGAALTTLRTPAVSVAAVADVLRHRFDSAIEVVLFGVGPQAAGHIRALETVAPIAGVTIAVRAPGRSASIAAELESRGIAVREVASGTATADDAVAGADVVIAATTAREPLFDGARVGAGAVVMAVGSHEPDARELDSTVMGRARVIVESRESAMRECGDVVMAVRDGALDGDSLLPMDAVVAGRAVIGDGAPVVFKGSGMAWEDLVIGSTVFDKTIEGTR